MKFENLYSAIELNFDYYAARGLSVYMPYIIATPITMPIQTREALIKAWNDTYDAEYASDKSKLWLENIRLQHVKEKVSIACKGESSPPFDLLLDNLQVVDIDLTLPNWKDELNTVYQNMHVQKHQAQHQLLGLAQSTMEKLAPMPIVNTNMANWAEGLKASLEAEVVINRARKALWPFIMSHLICDVSGLETSGLSCLNLWEERKKASQKFEGDYAYYQDMMKSLTH